MSWIKTSGHSQETLDAAMRQGFTHRLWRNQQIRLMVDAGILYICAADLMRVVKIVYFTPGMQLNFRKSFLWQEFFPLSIVECWVEELENSNQRSVSKDVANLVSWARDQLSLLQEIEHTSRDADHYGDDTADEEKGVLQ